jgi:hypothetical protein
MHLLLYIHNLPFVWTLSPPSKDVVIMALVVQKFVDWDTLVINAHLIDYVNLSICCNYSYIPWFPP